MRKYLLVYCLIIVSIATAQDWGLSETARTAGMGNAFTSVSEGANSMVFNPAGLLESERHTVLMTYSKDYSGLDFGSLYQASLLYAPINQDGAISFGVGANMFSEDVFEMLSGSIAFGGRVFRIGGRSGYFSLFGVGNLYRVNYNSGGFYWIDEEDEDPAGDPVFASGYNKITYGADVAFLMKIKRFRLGGRVSNLNEPNLSLEDVEAGTIPRKARVGVSYNIMDIITPSFDYEMPLGDVGIQDDATYHIGAESWLFDNAIGVRAGFTSKTINGGVSLQKNTGFGAGIDYALIYPRFEEDISLITHKVTVNLGTKIPPPKRYDLTIVQDSLRTIPDILSPNVSGKIIIPVKNIEKDPVKPFKVTAFYRDSTEEIVKIGTKTIPGLKGGETINAEISWKTPNSDFFDVQINVDDDGSRLPKLSGTIFETNEDNNTASFEVASFSEPNIDKVSPERNTLEISQVSFIKEELPIFPSIYFDRGSAEIPDRFSRMLRTLAQRLSENKDVKYLLYGYYDIYTEDDLNHDQLAVNRAESVKKQLVDFGASANQIQIVKKDYDKGKTRATGKEGRKPHEASLQPVSEENRRVEFQTSMMQSDPVLVEVEIDPKSGNVPAAEMRKLEEAARNSTELLRRNPDVELEIISYHEMDSRIAFSRIKEAEENIVDNLGYFLEDRIFEAFKPSKSDKDIIELRYSGEPLIYKPLSQINVPEGFRIAEEKGNLITLDGLSIDAPVDTFYVKVIDNEGQTFRLLDYGKRDVPQRVNWNWRSDEGEPPNPSRDYYIEFYLRDILGREITSKSSKLSIDAEKMEHREELVLINFHFAGTSPKSDYIEARIENVAKEIVEQTQDPFESMEIIIGGHTDIIGSEDVNMRLSEKRATRELQNLRTYLVKYLELPGDEALQEWLESKNIDLKAKAYGPDRPYVISIWEKGYYKTREIGNNEYPEGRILNRRVSVEIKIKM
ncbi:MAG: OmpA family protein [Candidatus Zixiibacteriota bacterium]